VARDFKNPNKDFTEISDYPGALNGNVYFICHMEQKEQVCFPSYHTHAETCSLPIPFDTWSVLFGNTHLEQYLNSRETEVKANVNHQGAWRGAQGSGAVPEVGSFFGIASLLSC